MPLTTNQTQINQINQINQSKQSMPTNYRTTTNVIDKEEAKRFWSI